MYLVLTLPCLTRTKVHAVSSKFWLAGSGTVIEITRLNDIIKAVWNVLNNRFRIHIFQFSIAPYFQYFSQANTQTNRNSWSACCLSKQNNTWFIILYICLTRNACDIIISKHWFEMRLLCFLPSKYLTILLTSGLQAPLCLIWNRAKPISKEASILAICQVRRIRVIWLSPFCTLSRAVWSSASLAYTWSLVSLTCQSQVILDVKQLVSGSAWVHFPFRIVAWISVAFRSCSKAYWFYVPSIFRIESFLNQLSFLLNDKIPFFANLPHLTHHLIILADWSAQNCFPSENSNVSHRSGIIWSEFHIPSMSVNSVKNI